MRAIRGTTLFITTSAVALIGGAALAQTAAPAAPLAPAATDAGTADVGEIVVTGSRLQASGFTTPTPVTVVGQQALQERAPGAILDGLNELPAFRNSGSTTSGARGAGGVGQNTVNLRGLGSNRNLVLVNGQRIVGVGAAATIDTNVIPVALVDRVEVVTGGASAAYGSDAVSGVVNFILKDRMEGVSVDYHYGISKYQDNIENSLSFSAGHSFADNRIHVIFGADYLKNKGVDTLYSRPWGAIEPGTIGLPATRAAGLPATLITSDVEYASYTPGGIITAGPLKGTTFGPGGTTGTMPYGLIGGTVQTGTTANYGSSVQDLQPIKIPIDRFSSLARATFDLDDNTSLYVEGGYAFSDAHSRTFTYLSSSIISASNPYLPASVAAALAANKLSTFTLGRENLEFGGIKSEPIQQVYRGDAGVKGKIGADWTWEVGYAHGETRYQYRPYDQTLTANFNAAIYAVRDPTTGQIVCGPTATNPNLTAATAANVKPGCVPFNPFGAGAPSQASIYYQGLSYLDSRVDHRAEDSGFVTFTGQPLKLWAGPVDVAFGAETRADTYHQQSSLESQLRLFNVGNQPTFGGVQRVAEGFGEIGVPLLTDQPLAKSLAFNGAVRYTSYSTSGNVTTWKAGGTYEPDDVFRFRATWSRDIRAPTINDLYTPGGGGTCPSCRGVNNNIGFVTTVSTGNPNLQPEIADTFTGGVVFQPKWGFTKNFRASIDYFNIRINGAIGSVAVQDVIDRCLRQNLQQYCSFITFDPTTPVGISNVTLAPLNLNQVSTKGVDFELSYKVPTVSYIPGVINLRLLGNYTPHLITITPITGGGSSSVDQGGGSQPKWRWTFGTDYAVGRLTAGALVSVQSSQKYDVTQIGPDSPAYSPSLTNSINKNLFPGVMYIDLNAAYDLPNVMGSRRFQLYGLVQNLMNQKPPLGYTFVLSGSGNGGYDEVGRNFKVGIRFQY